MVKRAGLAVLTSLLFVGGSQFGFSASGAAPAMLRADAVVIPTCPSPQKPHCYYIYDSNGNLIGYACLCS